MGGAGQKGKATGRTEAQGQEVAQLISEGPREGYAVDRGELVRAKALEELDGRRGAEPLGCAAKGRQGFSSTKARDRPRGGEQHNRTRAATSGP